MGPVVQRAQAVDSQVVEKCGMFRRIILHFVLAKRMSALVAPTQRILQPESLVPIVKDSGGSVMLWGAFSWHCLGAVIPLEGKVNANRT